MSGKKHKKATMTGTVPALKIGSRVRCTDDGAEGRIAWANAVSVKIKWDDGEQVTWRRDEVANKPIEFLAEEAGAVKPEADTVQSTGEMQAEAPALEPSVTTPVEAPTSETPAAPAPTEVAATVEPTEATVEAAATAEVQQVATNATPANDTVVEGTAPAKPKRERKVKTPAEPKEKKVSALDAAARVLVEAGQMLTCKELIGHMAAKGYWATPGGKTPDATLASAILREIKVKGEQSRFVKAASGRFAARTAAPTSTN